MRCYPLLRTLSFSLTQSSSAASDCTDSSDASSALNMVSRDCTATQQPRGGKQNERVCHTKPEGSIARASRQEERWRKHSRLDEELRGLRGLLGLLGDKIQSLDKCCGVTWSDSTSRSEEGDWRGALGGSPAWRRCL